MGKPYRYGFAASSNRDWGDAHGYNCTGRLILKPEKPACGSSAPQANAGEPVHTNPDSEREEDGWSCVCTIRRGRVSLHLSAGDFTGGRCARYIPGVPQRLPRQLDATPAPVSGDNGNTMRGDIPTMSNRLPIAEGCLPGRRKKPALLGSRCDRCGIASFPAAQSCMTCGAGR